MSDNLNKDSHLSLRFPLGVPFRGVDVAIPRLERDLDGRLDLSWLGLPGACSSTGDKRLVLSNRKLEVKQKRRTEAQRGHLGTGVQHLVLLYRRHPSNFQFRLSRYLPPRSTRHWQGEGKDK